MEHKGWDPDRKTPRKEWVIPPPETRTTAARKQRRELLKAKKALTDSRLLPQEVHRHSGLDAATLADHLTTHLAKLKQLAEAKKTQVITHQGVVTDLVEMEDNTTQVKAAAEALKIIVSISGLEKRTAPHSPENKATEITINLPWLSPPTEKDVTPLQNPDFHNDEPSLSFEKSPASSVNGAGASEDLEEPDPESEEEPT